MEILRILSDLHLAHPATQVDRVESLLPLFEGIQEVWLNGDTLETCSEALGAESLRQLGLLQVALDARGIRTVLLRGNHDTDLPGPAWRFLEDGEVLVTHGDACFRYGSPWSPWVDASRPKLDQAENARGGFEAVTTLDQRCALAADYARAFYPRHRLFSGFAGKLETIAHAAWPPATAFRILDAWLKGPDIVARWMETFAPSAKVILMGHTHRPGIWRRGNRWIVNTGAYHPFGFPRVVDATPGRLDIRRVYRRGGGFTPGPVRQSLVRRHGVWSLA